MRTAWAMARYVFWTAASEAAALAARRLDRLADKLLREGAGRAYFEVTDEIAMRAYDQGVRPQEREP